jgi:short-subunit dehydrogenase
MKKMRNKVVVITGASSGFGRGAALKFAEAGANVVVAARRKRLLKDLAEKCQQLGVEALAVEADVSEASEVEELASQAVNRFGGIDVWVNNAGVGTFARFEEAPLEEHEQVIKTNLLGTIYGSYAALKQFRTQEEGVLINVGSFAGMVAPPYLSSYAASKFGVRGLGMALRQELEQNGDDEIQVCTVMPVSMDTPFFEHAANHTGKPVRPIPPVYDPEKVIDTILEVALNPEDEVVVGTSGKVGSVGERLAPKLTRKQMGKQAHRAQMNQEGSAKDSPGSVFRPMKTGDDVRGGWRDGDGQGPDTESEGSGSALTAVLGLAVPVAMGLAYVLSRRRNVLTSQDAA